MSGAVFLPADQPLRPAGQPEIGQQIGGSLYQRINRFFPSGSPAPLLQRITHSFTPADQPPFPQRIIRSPAPADQPLLPQRIIRSPTPADQPLLPQRIIRLHTPADKPLFPRLPHPSGSTAYSSPFRYSPSFYRSHFQATSFFAPGASRKRRAAYPLPCRSTATASARSTLRTGTWCGRLTFALRSS